MVSGCSDPNWGKEGEANEVRVRSIMTRLVTCDLRLETSSGREKSEVAAG